MLSEQKMKITALFCRLTKAEDPDTSEASYRRRVGTYIHATACWCVVRCSTAVVTIN